MVGVGEITQHRVARRTGTTITVERTGPGSWVEQEPGWMTLCLNHGQLCMHDTRALAEAHAAFPDEWCSDCRRIVDGHAPRPTGRIE